MSAGTWLGIGTWVVVAVAYLLLFAGAGLVTGDNPDIDGAGIVRRDQRG